MEFTKEQLEKIILEAPEGAIFWYSGVYADFYYKIIGSHNRYLPGNRFSLTDLAERLQEMKMQESMQVEIDNTAQQVDSLCSALTMSERDIEDALELDGKGLPPVGCEIKVSEGVGVVLSTSKECDGVVTYSTDNGLSIHCVWNDKSWVNPIETPEQKQQKIDEANGKNFYDIQHDITDVDMWDTVDIEDKHYWIEFAKKVSFEGKLESI